jgi:hypothetical protein
MLGPLAESEKGRLKVMMRILTLSLLLAVAAAPLGGCLTISWQDDSATAAENATVAAVQRPATVSCSNPGVWDSTGEARDISGTPKEFNCPKATQ